MATTLIPILRTVDFLANAMLIGVPIWVFFPQSPLLFKFMGRDKFISPMMFRWTLPSCALVSLACYLVIPAAEVTAAGVVLVSVWINALVVVPRALQEGKQATRSKDNTKSAAAFAMEGGHQTDTKALHQPVIILVVNMLVGAITHVHSVVNV